MGPAINGSFGDKEELLDFSEDEDINSELELISELEDSILEELELMLLELNDDEDEISELEELDSVSEEDDDL